MVNVTFRDRTKAKKNAHIHLMVHMEKKGLILSASLKVNYPKTRAQSNLTSTTKFYLNAPTQCKLNFIPNLKVDNVEF